MKYPIFEDFSFLDNDFLNTKIHTEQEHLKSEFKHISYRSFRTTKKVLQSVSKDNILIQASNYEWDSKVSLKSLKELRLRTFNFPFKSGAIDTTKERYYYTVENDIVYLLKHRKEDKENFPYEIGKDSKISESIAIIGTDFYSILLYISTFKDDATRIEKAKKVKAKKSKKYYSHTVSIINLKQSIKNYELKKDANHRKKIDKVFLVRGHFRLQPYKEEIKPKWIDSYYKGKDNQEQKPRVYKIGA